MRRAAITLVSVLAVLVAAAVAVDRLAPPQDLPWKPFDLDQPVGLATHLKLAAMGADGARCRAALAAGGIEFDPSPPSREGGCHQLGAGRIAAGAAPLSPARPVMTCSEALAFAVWERHVVQPAARRSFGAGVVRITHLGTYACRPIRGQTVRLSEHAYANAIDVAAFRLTDGREVAVLRDFPTGDAKAVFLRQVHAGGCRVFGHTLGPDYNADHRDHFHLDMGAFPWVWGGCR